MIEKGIFQNKSPWFQLLLLLLLVLAGLLISSFLTVLYSFVRYGFEASYVFTVNELRWLQFLSVILSFLLPAMLAAWLFSKKPGQYLRLKTYPTAKVVWWVFVSLLALTPTISLTAALNEQLSLPSFMEPIERWMQAQEQSATEMTDMFLAETGVWALIGNLIVIALSAAVVEEFLFRGSMTRIFERIFRNPHATIWTVAIIFSAIHMQFYGFIPRILLGAFLGYLVYWSRNIWLPVIAHFLNNAMAVVAMSDSDLKENPYISGDMSDINLLPLAIAAAVCLVLFYFSIRALRRAINE